jgi:Lon-like protease
VLTLTVRRDAEEVEVVVTLGEAEEVDWPVIGILIETAVIELQLPFDIHLADGTRIGGPSAGMMVALTVYDLLSDEDLLRGRMVMGTGTMDADGRVGTVGGVPEKMRAVAVHDPPPDLVLVPQAQFDVAREAAPDWLPVVGVRTFDEALEALRQD